jgi:hypothetical protein
VDTDLYISYDGGIGIHSVVKGLLTFLNRTFGNSIIEEDNFGILVIHLVEVEQFHKLLDVITLKDISFDSRHIIIETELK